LKRTIAVLSLLISVSVLAQDATAPVAPQGGSQTLTFQQALERALVVNNAVERSRSQIAGAEANRRLLFSAVLPRINVDGNLTRNSLEQTFGEGSDAIAILPRNNWDYRLTLQQPIFAGRRELRAYAQSKIAVENARFGSFATEEGTLLQVASSYLALVNAEARLEIERRNIELAEKRRRQAQAFYDAGEVTRVDVLRADTAVKAAQRVQSAVEQGRETAESALREALDINGEISVVTPERPLPATLDESALIARAENREDVRIAANNVRIANLEVAKQRGFALPTVRFEAGFVQQKSPFPTPEYGYGTLNFHIPVFQSGEVGARVAGARAQELQAKLDYETARNAAREDVRTALAELRSAETSLGLAREQLAAAEAEYTQAFELYRAQEATSLDVAASETSLADARRAVAEESLNRDIAALRLWYAAGAIREAVGVASPAATTEAQTSAKENNDNVAAAAQE
jgi:outer membrane protein